jgi:hypothetical protein
MLTGLTLAALAACVNDDPTLPELTVSPAAATVAAGRVDDLTAIAATNSTVELRWTQVDDGTGKPAQYRLKFAEPSIEWATATIGCNAKGSSIGSPITCTVSGLSEATLYDFQLMSFRTSGGQWKGATYSNVAKGQTAGASATATPDPDPVTTLAVSEVTESSITVRWTEVGDGLGGPASYQVKYAPPPLDWSTATEVCVPHGTWVGAEQTCKIEGLAADAAYSVLLVSYRGPDAWTFSNMVNARTAAPVVTQQQHSGSGIWISPAEIAELPMSGSAWNNVLAAANSSCGGVDLANQDQSNNVCIMAKALVFARTGTTSYRTAVVDAISQIVWSGTYVGRALALGRELGAYVVAADLIDLQNVDPGLDASFRDKLRELRWTYTSGAAANLIDCHEKRPNNWGTHCGATRAAIAVYLGDTGDLERAAQVFKGFLGDRSSYAGFDYGDDLSWQCDPSRPVGINPSACWKGGGSIDGVIPDDQRRGGSFTWPAPHENYVWESLQGLLAQAVILSRAGYPVWDWEDRALLRAVRWLHDVNGYAAEGDDRWLPHIVNRAYGTSFPAPSPTTGGKNFGWTDWTHR